MRSFPGLPRPYNQAIAGDYENPITQHVFPVVYLSWVTSLNTHSRVYSVLLKNETPRLPVLGFSFSPLVLEAAVLAAALQEPGPSDTGTADVGGASFGAQAPRPAAELL